MQTVPGGALMPGASVVGDLKAQPQYRDIIDAAVIMRFGLFARTEPAQSADRLKGGWLKKTLQRS